MTAYPFRKHNGRLIPSSEEALEAMIALKDGHDVMVSFHTARNPRHHKLYFALIRLMKEHAVHRVTGESLFAEADTETIHTALKIATGLVRTFVDCDTGKTVMVPLSIAFESMPQDKFSAFFDSAVSVICRRWLPEGSVEDDVRREVEAMVDPMPGRRSA